MMLRVCPRTLSAVSIVCPCQGSGRTEDGNRASARETESIEDLYTNPPPLLKTLGNQAESDEPGEPGGIQQVSH